MKKETRATIPILIALIGMAALGQAGHENADENNCNFEINIVEGSSSSVEAELNATSPQNLTVVWHYANQRSLQSYFRSENGFNTDFNLQDERELESIEAKSLDCKNISGQYP